MNSEITLSQRSSRGEAARQPAALGKSGTYTLWSIQTRDVAHVLQSGRPYRAQWAKVEVEYRVAYRWLVAEMKERGLNTQGRPPVWAWYKYGEDHCRPDLRNRWLLYKGTPGVMFELRVPVSEVILSQFQMWVCFLNDTANISRNSKGKPLEDLRVLPHGAANRSYRKMFDLKTGNAAHWGPLRKREIQANLTHIRPEWVVRQVEFVAR